METVKLHRLSRIRVPKGKESPDSIERSKAINTDERARGQQILMEAQHHYMAAYKARVERERNLKYTYGNQLDDVVSVDGVRMTEEEYIKRQGGVPLTMNLIQKHLRGVVGTFREQNSEPLCVARDRNEQQEAETLSILLQYNMQLNQMGEMYADGMRDYTIGGGIVHKKLIGWNVEKNLDDCWTYKVPFNAFIPDSNMRDLRGWDCTFVGQIHDYDFNTLLSQYAHSPEDYKKLVDIYKQARDVISGEASWQDFGYSNPNQDFLVPVDTSRCRVIEVWRKETKPRVLCHDWNSGTLYKIDPEDFPTMVEAENQRRMIQAAEAGIPKEEVPLIEVKKWFVDSFWYFYFLSPFGDILKEGETQYDHKSHPFVFKFYPFLDGEIHSFVSDLVPLQRYTNRLVMLNDMILRSTAKGLLVIPRKALKGGLTEEKVGLVWAKPNGVLVVDSTNKDEMPYQIASNLTNIGIHEMLAMNLKFFDDIGINGSLQGKANYSGESGAHAQVMAQNASTSLVDLLESFKAFECDAAYKDMKNIQQYYDKKKVMDIVGDNAKGMGNVNPEKVLNLEADISIAQGKKTASYRALANEFFLNLFNQQAISVEQLLESVIDIPGAEELLQNIRSQRQQAEQGIAPEGISPELLRQVQAGLNPNPQAMEQLNQAVYGQQATA